MSAFRQWQSNTISHSGKSLIEHDTPDTRYIVLLDGDFPVATCRLYELPEDEAELPTMMLWGVLSYFRNTGKHSLGPSCCQRSGKMGQGNWGCRKAVLDSRDVAVGFLY